MRGDSSGERRAPTVSAAARRLVVQRCPPWTTQRPWPARRGKRAPARGLIRSIAHRLAGDAAALPVEGRLASFDGATGWLNSEPLTPEGLRGRVVLVDFWTYTCVNWLRTLPYVRAWAAKYAGAGLTVVGVHTPEFGFERDVDNVIAQARHSASSYPIAVDNDYAVWRAFANHSWPAVYVADAEGRIRFHHFGEGEYAQTEMVIQQLLLDAGARDVDQDLVAVEPRGLEVAADWRTLRSPETYLGYGQSTGFASEDVARPSTSPTSTPPRPAPAQLLGPRGDLDRGPARRGAERARRARRLPVPRARPQPRHGPGRQGARSRSGSSSTGRPRTARHGSDVGPDGRGIVGDQRTYQLIRQSDRSPPAGSRSSSATRAWRCTASRSADGGRTLGQRSTASGHAPVVGAGFRGFDRDDHRLEAGASSPNLEFSLRVGAHRWGYSTLEGLINYQTCRIPPGG